MSVPVKYGMAQTGLLDELRQRLRGRHAAVHVCLVGEPGAGKTRLVLEATRTDDLTPVIAYCASPEECMRSGLVDALVHDTRLHTILVVDDCELSDAQSLWNTLQHHVYKSTDGAATWTALDLEISSVFSPDIGAIVLDPFTPSIVYVVSGGSALYKSTDEGESWTVANPGPFSSLLAIAPANPATLYAIRFGSGFSRSADGGTTWTAMSLTQSVQAVAVDPSDPRVLYAAVSRPKRYRAFQTPQTAVFSG